MSEPSPIVVPTVRLTIEHGLDEDGRAITGELWENLMNPDEPVDMMTRAGILTMAQQTLTFLALGLDEEDDEDE